MNRPTRVPASTVVRINKASNMMAKWYQNACSAVPPMTLEKIWLIPTASVGAPPVLPMMLSSPTAAAVLVSVCASTENPKPLTAWAADWAVSPRRAGLAFIAKYTPGSRARRRDNGHHGDERLHEHGPVPDHAHLRLFLDELGRRPRGHERVEPGERPAGDGDEHEREEGAGEDGPLRR